MKSGLSFISVRQVVFYILDEPTTGLHTEDISRFKVLERFVDGNTVLVIEHNLDVIKTADHIIDLDQKVVSVVVPLWQNTRRSIATQLAFCDSIWKGNYNEPMNYKSTN